MTIARTLTRLGFAASLAACAWPAAAVDFDFYKLGRGAAQDFLPSDGVACTGGDLCSSNVNGGVYGGDLTFSAGGVTAVATSSFASGVSAVVQDHTSGWTFGNSAGLGVYHSKDTSDDNITFGEALTLTFDRWVTLTSIGLRAEGHNVNGWDTGATFLLNGTRMLLPDNVGTIGNLSLSGTSFTFAFDSARTADQFYVASVVVTPVPEPETWALMLGGLGALGAVARRRRPR